MSSHNEEFHRLMQHVEQAGAALNGPTDAKVKPPVSKAFKAASKAAGTKPMDVDAEEPVEQEKKAVTFSSDTAVNGDNVKGKTEKKPMKVDPVAIPEEFEGEDTDEEDTAFNVGSKRKTSAPSDDEDEDDDDEDDFRPKKRRKRAALKRSQFVHDEACEDDGEDDEEDGDYPEGGDDDDDDDDDDEGEDVEDSDDGDSDGEGGDSSRKERSSRKGLSDDLKREYEKLAKYRMDHAVEAVEAATKESKAPPPRRPAKDGAADAFKKWMKRTLKTEAEGDMQTLIDSHLYEHIGQLMKEHIRARLKKDKRFDIAKSSLTLPLQDGKKTPFKFKTRVVGDDEVVEVEVVDEAKLGEAGYEPHDMGAVIVLPFDKDHSKTSHWTEPEVTAVLKKLKFRHLSYWTNPEDPHDYITTFTVQFKGQNEIVVRVGEYSYSKTFTSKTVASQCMRQALRLAYPKKDRAELVGVYPNPRSFCRILGIPPFLTHERRVYYIIPQEIHADSVLYVTNTRRKKKTTKSNDAKPTGKKAKSPQPRPRTKQTTLDTSVTPKPSNGMKFPNYVPLVMELESMKSDELYKVDLSKSDDDNRKDLMGRLTAWMVEPIGQRVDGFKDAIRNDCLSLLIAAALEKGVSSKMVAMYVVFAEMPEIHQDTMSAAISSVGKEFGERLYAHREKEKMTRNGKKAVPAAAASTPATSPTVAKYASLF